MFSNGEKYEGNFFNGKFEGEGIKFLIDGKEIKGFWKNGELIETEIDMRLEK
jgi:hypothetical protein